MTVRRSLPLFGREKCHVAGQFLVALLVGCGAPEDAFLGGLPTGAQDGPATGPSVQPDADQSAEPDVHLLTAPGANQDGNPPGQADPEVQVPEREGDAVVCEDDTEQVAYANSGLPLLESNPGAPVALYLDFGGGRHDGWHDPFDIDGDEDTFGSEEQEAIIRGWRWTEQYYAMFDVNVTTDRAARDRTGNYTWTLVYGDYDDSSGLGEWGGSGAVGELDRPKSSAGAHALTEENQGYLIAHEVGHNFTLEHNGEVVRGDWYKWDEQPDFRENQGGPLMGGRHSGFFWWGKELISKSVRQDSMEVIRHVIMDVGGSSTGWRPDDFDQGHPEPLCLGERSLYRRGILERPDDVDVFLLSWPGGPFSIEAGPVGVSAAQLVVELEKNGVSLGDATDNDSLEPGLYEIRVESNGTYGAIGAYEIRIDRAE